MSTEDLIRSWKDPEQRPEELAAAHPAGDIELGADPLVGGTLTGTLCTPYFSYIDITCNSACVTVCLNCY